MESRHRIADFSDARILVTNDDGIYAPGLKVLEGIARELSDDVWVVAPEVEQSGAAHSISIHSPLRFYAMEERKFAVRGTPTDCVLFAVEKLFKTQKKPQLLLSGVNRGANVAEDITHSGTLAAAMEGTLCGIPSIAMSQAFAMWDPNAVVSWELPEKMGADLIRKVMTAGLPENIFININFPDLPLADIGNVRVTSQGRRLSGKNLDERLDIHGRPYYWIHWRDDDEVKEDDSDISALTSGHVTITPLCIDLTDYRMVDILREHMNDE